MQMDHFLDNRFWCAKSAKRSTLILIERSNAAEGAVPRATTAAENRGGRHRMPLVVDRLTIRPRENVEVFDSPRERCDSDFIVVFAEERNSGQLAPVRVRSETIQQFDE